MYKALFKPLESIGAYDSALVPQLAISKFFHDEDTTHVNFPQQPGVPPQHIPTTMRTHDPRTSKTTLGKVETFPPPEGSKAHIKEYRRWLIPDFSLVVSRPHEEEATFTFNEVVEDWKVEITGPALSGEEVIVPLIVEVKAQRSDDPYRIMQTLMDAEAQLRKQAQFVFSQFDSELLQDVIAIAGVGLYWLWFKIPRSSTLPHHQGPNEEFQPQGHLSPDSVDPPLGQAQTTPFIIGTEESVKAVLEVRAMVQEVVRQCLLEVTSVPDDPEDPLGNNTADYYEFLGAIRTKI